MPGRPSHPEARTPHPTPRTRRPQIRWATGLRRNPPVKSATTPVRIAHPARRRQADGAEAIVVDDPAEHDPAMTIEELRAGRARRGVVMEARPLDLGAVPLRRGVVDGEDGPIGGVDVLGDEPRGDGGDLDGLAAYAVEAWQADPARGGSEGPQVRCGVRRRANDSPPLRRHRERSRCRVASSPVERDPKPSSVATLSSREAQSLRRPCPIVAAENFTSPCNAQ